MELEIPSAALSTELDCLRTVAARKSSIEILTNIAIDAFYDGRVRFTASDTNNTMVIDIKADVKAEGSTCAPAAKLLDICKLAKGSKVRMKLNSGATITDSRLQVSADSMKYKLPVMDRARFPETPDIKNNSAIVVPSQQLAQLIDKTSFAITQNEGRYSLHCIKLTIIDGYIKAASTDQHRVAMLSLKLPEEPLCDFDSMIPNETFSELAKLCEVHDGDVAVSHSENHNFFRFGNRLLVSRTMLGEFPNCEFLMPRAITAAATFNTKRLSLGVKRAALATTRNDRCVRLEFADSSVKLSASTSEQGDSEEIVPAESSDANMVIGFNHQYLHDFLEHVDSDNVVISLQASETQAMLAPAQQQEGSDYCYILMPMRF